MPLFYRALRMVAYDPRSARNILAAASPAAALLPQDGRRFFSAPPDKLPGNIRETRQAGMPA
jgi:hypothetical protein